MLEGCSPEILLHMLEGCSEGTSALCAPWLVRTLLIAWHVILYVNDGTFV